MRDLWPPVFYSFAPLSLHLDNRLEFVSTWRLALSRPRKPAVSFCEPSDVLS